MQSSSQEAVGWKLLSESPPQRRMNRRTFCSSGTLVERYLHSPLKPSILNLAEGQLIYNHNHMRLSHLLLCALGC